MSDNGSSLTAPSTDTDLLLAAADIIEQRGWVQGAFHGDKGGFCIRGAMRVALNQHPDAPPAANPARRIYIAARDRLNNFLSEHHLLDVVLPDGCDPGIEFNDTKGRTKAEVVDTLRRAAEVAA